MADRIDLGTIDVGTPIVISVVECDGEFWIEARDKRIGPYATRQVAEQALSNIEWGWTE